jgi:hypothetical protein
MRRGPIGVAARPCVAAHWSHLIKQSTLRTIPPPKPIGVFRECWGCLLHSSRALSNSAQQAGDFSERPHGLLRINAGYVAYASLIQPRLAEFGERYPENTLDIAIDNNLSDFVAGVLHER